MSESISQEVVLDASPKAVFAAFMQSEQHAAFTGAPATIDPAVGGAFSCFDGQIQGRNLDLVDGERIVQAWRVAVWPDGVYSLVRFDLTAEGKQTRVKLTHSSVPEGAHGPLSDGWHARYWKPLSTFFA